MSVGERIKYFRRKEGMTQEALGEALGFSEGQRDVRIAQYESGARKAKEPIKKALADALHVSPAAISEADIDSPEGMMHLFFMLEDQYGMDIGFTKSEVCLTLPTDEMDKKLKLMIISWFTAHVITRLGYWTQEQYDCFRYNFPNGLESEELNEWFRKWLEGEPAGRPDRRSDS